MRFFSFLRIASVVTVLLATLGVTAGIGQNSLQRSGRHFTFGIIEGPENLPGADLSSLSLILTVLSPYDGCGTITSPSGYAQDFSFTAMQATVISLPTKLIHLNDLGKTSKGLIVRTNEPVNLTLHDFILEAGDATQLYPDESLDTDYMVAEWGEWDDAILSQDTTIGRLEPNHSEILVTAPQDNTVVTITPSVLTMLKQPANVPFTVTLNAGECYIVKADSFGVPTRSSLSNSTVVSSKPVSVIVGTTCGYVPLTVESCNELMDEILGKRHWSQHYYISPLGNADGTDTANVRALLTSDRPFNFSVNGSPGFAPGRIALSFRGAADITASTPISLHELAVGNSQVLNGQSDPTLVSILDSSLWADTLLWNAPLFAESPYPFRHYVSMIYPTPSEGQIRLDNQLIGSLAGTRSQIYRSAQSTLVTPISPGVHSLTSPVPVFAVAAGWQSADAYTFLPGTISPEVRRDTIKHTLNVKVDSAMACHDFRASFSVSPPFADSEGVMSLTVTVALDPLITSFSGFQSLLPPESASISIDSTTPGFITVNIIAEPSIIDSPLFRLIFHGERTAALAVLTPGATLCADAIELLETTPAQFPVLAATDTLRHALTMDSSAAILCKPLELHLLLDSILGANESFLPNKIEITFDTSRFEFKSVTTTGLLRTLPVTTTGGANGELIVTIDTSLTVNGNDSLLLLTLLPRAEANNTPIHARLTYLVCDQLHTKDITLPFSVVVNVDTTTTRLSIMTAPVSFGNQASATVMLTGLPIGVSVTQFMLFVTYDHGLLRCTGAGTQGTLTSGWGSTLLTGVATDTLRFTSTNGPLGISGTLTNLLFQTFVANPTSSPIGVQSTLPAQIMSGPGAGCEILYSSRAVFTTFTGRDLCGDSLLRGFMRTGSILIQRAEQTQDGALDVTLSMPLAQALTVSVSDVLGHSALGEIVQGSPGEQTVHLLLNDIASGTYLLRIEGLSGRATRKVVILR
ncbi:MAG: T9SS type A sorting domain-containing protein [Bacteroidota bacterium]|nr:T9SS type A sorting domain-containing protein [Bacteroidota bacterium]